MPDLFAPARQRHLFGSAEDRKKFELVDGEPRAMAPASVVAERARMSGLHDNPLCASRGALLGESRFFLPVGVRSTQIHISPARRRRLITGAAAFRRGRGRRTSAHGNATPPDGPPLRYWRGCDNRSRPLPAPSRFGQGRGPARQSPPRTLSAKNHRTRRIPPWDHQDVGRALRADIVEGEDVCILINLVARDLAAQDAGEDIVAVVGHRYASAG